MSEDQVYKDGDIVWVKLGNNWWPGEVIDAHRHPDGIVTNIKRKLYCIVKFFNENAYEYVSNVKQIYPFQCAKKDEFLKKGLSLYKSGNKFMEKFPEDVEVAERLTRPKAPSLFINDRPDSIVKAILGQPLVLTGDDEYCGSSEYREKRRSSESITKIINITPNKTSSTAPAAAPIRIEHFITAASSSSAAKNNAKNISISSRTSIGDLSSRNNSINTNNNNNYRCNLCEFTSVRQNVMILHRKMHSNRNGPVPTTNHNANHNRNNHISTIDSNTKVNKTIVIKSPCTTATTKQNTSITSLKAPADVATNETVECTNSSKTSSSTIVVADSSSSELEVSHFAPNETHSRRSMRHMKTATTVTATATSAPTAQSIVNGSTLSIDLPETKPIKKIPKKRDFGNLNLHQEDGIEIPPVAQEVQISEALQATPTPATPPVAKGNAEEIRNMLLADWSDEDETPDHDNDRNHNDKGAETKNDVTVTSNNEIISLSPDLAITSTPFNTTKSLNTGRIRNIPKKDRRDVILQDFSGDLSMIEPVKESSAHDLVHLDSSNSSAVEVIEEQQQPIITINDDDEDAKDKVTLDNTKNKGQTNISDKLSPSRNSDLENVEPNDKSIAASILSCFDFQDDDDEDDIDTPTAVASSIAHFKKKYLSSERSQNQMANDGGGDISRAAKEKHEERAQKDQELTAEIDSLLEQTQPTPADLLTSSNSFEECMSVKDLPIKERSKRIFKSRNRSRIEGKSSTESLTNSVSTDESLTKEVSTIEMNYKPVSEKSGSMENLSKVADGSVPLKSPKDFVKSSFDGIVTMTPEDQLSREIAEHLPNGRNTNDENSPQAVIENSRDKEKDISEEISDHTPNEVELYVREEEYPIEIQEIEVTTNQVFVETTSVEEVQTGHEYLENPPTHVSPQELAPEYIQTPKNQDEILDDCQLKNTSAKSPVLENAEFLIGENTLSNEHVPSRNIEENDAKREASNAIEFNVNLNPNSDKENDDGVEINGKQVETDTNAIEVEEIARSEGVEEENETTGITQDITLELTSTAIEKRDGEEHHEEIDKCHPLPISAVVTEPEQAPTEEFANHRMINTSPTDENSSMGASDTGAEFGSPTSMLSEERLPTFPFNRNETPQQDVEAAENESKMEIPVCVTANLHNDKDNTENITSPKETVAGEVAPNETDKCNQILNAETKEDINVQTKKNMMTTSEHLLKKMGENEKKEETKSTEIKESSVSPSQSLSHKIAPNVEPVQTPIDFASPLSEKSHNRKRRHVKNTPRRNVKEVLNHSVERLQANKQEVSTDLPKVVSSEIDFNRVGSNGGESSMQDSQEENSEKSEENRSELPKAETTSSLVIKTTEKIERNPVEIDEKLPASPEDYIDNTEMTKKPSTNEAADNAEDIAVNVVETPSNESIANSEETTEKTDTCLQIVVRAKADDVDCNTVEDINKCIDTDTKPVIEFLDDVDREKAKNEEKMLSEDTTANETGNDVIIDVPRENSSEARETECRNIAVKTRGKKNKQNEDGTSEAHQSTSNCSIEDKSRVDLNIKENNRDTINTKTNVPCTQKKRSGETILLSKSKHRKQEPEEATTNKQATKALDYLETAIVRVEESVSESESATKSRQYEIEKPINSEAIVEKTFEEIPREEEHIAMSPTAVNQSVQSDSGSILPCTENNSLNSDSHDIEIPLSPGIPPSTPQEKEVIIECDSLNTPPTTQPKDLIIECETTVECESLNPPLATQQKDLIIECETTVPTPTHVIDFDCIGPSPTSEDKDVVIDCETEISEDKDLIVEVETVVPNSNLQVNDIIEYGDVAAAPIVLGKDVIVVSDANSLSQPEDHITGGSNEHLQLCDKNTLITSQPSATETESDADKATHDFLIEFDNLVNQTTKQNVEVFNAEDIINNIIVEVQGDNHQQTKMSEPNYVRTTDAPVDAAETIEMTNICPPTTSPRPLYRQSKAVKRRQTICFDISESSVGSVSRKRQVYDFEESLPTTTKALKRTAERKMTMPDIDRPNSRSPLGFDRQFKSFRPRRRSSIEDSISTFSIQRPNVAQDEDELFQELFDTPSSTSSTDSNTTKQHKPSKPSGNDSRGNKYVFIKNTSPQETSKTALQTKAANGRNMKRKASQTKTTGRRLSMQTDNPPHSKIPRDATGCVAIQPKLPKTDLIVTALNDSQISTAQQQLIQLQQQPQTQSSSIILNTNSSRARKTHKSAQNQQQQPNSNQSAAQQIQLQQQNALQQQQQQQQQLITQLANQQNVLQFVSQPAPQQQHMQHVQHANEGFIITTATPSEDDNVIDSNTQLIALPTQPYPGYTETFLLCKVKGNTCKPVDNVPLYLNHQLNELVPIPADVLEAGPKLVTDDNSSECKQSNAQQHLMGQDKANLPHTGITDGSDCSTVPDTDTVVHQDFLQDIGGAATSETEATADLTTNNGILLNIEGQQVLLDAATFAHLLANPDTNTQLISDDGTEYVLTHEVLQALHMQQQQQQQEQQQQQLGITNAGVNNDIIAVAMAESDLYGNGVLAIDTSQALQLIDGSGSVVFQQPTTPSLVQQHLTPPAVVTNAILDQSPIMSALEVPSNSRLQVPHCITVPSSLPIVTPSNVVLGGNTRCNLDDSLAAIGVTAQSSSISSALGLPITVTDPNIASKVTSAGPLNEILQFVSHRPATAQATAAAVAAAALAGELRIFND